MTRRLLIKNVKGLVQVETETRLRKRSGAEMKNLPILEDAWLALEEDRIMGFGRMEDWEGISDWNGLEVIDATGKFVLPCWNDPHTHIFDRRDQATFKAQLGKQVVKDCYGSCFPVCSGYTHQFQFG